MSAYLIHMKLLETFIEIGRRCTEDLKKVLEWYQKEAKLRTALVKRRLERTYESSNSESR